MSRGLSLCCLSLSRAPISPRTKIRGRAELLSFPAPQLADPVDIPYRINMIVNQAEGYGAAPFGGGFAVLADNLLLHPVTKEHSPANASVSISTIHVADGALPLNPQLGLDR